MCWREAGAAGVGWRFCRSQSPQLGGGDGWRTFFFLETSSLPNVEGRGGPGGERGSRGAEE